MTEHEWRTLLQLIIKHVSSRQFQQWDSFSLLLPDSRNRLYVHWGLQPPHGREFEHLYPLMDPATGRAEDQP